MNEMQNNSDNNRGGYDPKLELYHPNAKGTGAAISLSLTPATSDQDGCVFLSIASQVGTGASATADQPRRFATFNWQAKIVAKINFFEICDILMVFAGGTPVLVHAGKNGLYHSTANANTAIDLKRSDDAARPGFLLGVSKTLKADGTKQHAAFFLSIPEALGLRLALEQSMGLLAFGVPRARAASGESSARRAEADAPAAYPPAFGGVPNVYGLASFTAPSAAKQAAAAPAAEEAPVANVPGGF